ncbi:hypothetical protein BWQ96_05127 [Gracilariopsis chorda]|uniref:Transmembrane protein n=1 Tax=Gracilariopsis chorda TaxID=448386 RepID=A0A2V3ISI7_9FLOR|nr:hypothetical protein BWQ96_05127 [Gracilariopsis chorda]|eukprot:PXF45088.1 hypothetical protein BWQ96_05127 [Gracilariopsis chorda]
MVLIPLKSQYTSLIATILSGLAELALLSAVLGYNKYLECRALENGGRVNVRHHRFRTRALTVAATLAFVFLEVSNSFFSDPALKRGEVTKSCISLDALPIRRGMLDISLRAAVVGINCLGTNTSLLWQLAGNISDDGEIKCGDDFLFSADIHHSPNEPVPDEHTMECILDGELNLCAFLYSNGSEVTFTEIVLDTDLSFVLDNNYALRVWKTTVYYNTTGMERELLRRSITLARDLVTDQFVLRREVFAGAEETECNFDVFSPATTIKEGFLYAIAVAWTLSLAAFLGSLAIRGRVFYDMSDPLDWARQTVRDEDSSDIDNPVVTTRYENGTRFVLVTRSSAPSEEESNVGTLFRRRRTQQSSVGDLQEVI